MAQRRLTTILARSALVLGAVVGSLLAAELVTRGMGWEVPAPPRREGDVLIERKDKDLIWQLKPGAVHRQIYEGPDGAEEFVAEMSVNRFGYRGAAVPKSKTPGRVRVACIGDSYTFGDGVSDDETWPAALEAVLRERPDGERFEVMNWGVNNYDTLQEVALIEKRVLAFEPDVVLLAFFLNDAAIHRLRGAGSGSGQEFGAMSATHQFLTRDGWVRSLRKSSRLFDLIADRIVRREYLTYLGQSRSQLYDEEGPGWRVARRELVRARDLLEARDIRFAVILYPLLFRVGDQLATHDAYQIVAEFCRSEGIEALDLEPTFLEHDVDPLRVHARNTHPNARAHRLAAERIGTFAEERFLPLPDGD